MWQRAHPISQYEMKKTLITPSLISLFHYFSFLISANKTLFTFISINSCFFFVIKCSLSKYNFLKKITNWCSVRASPPMSPVGIRIKFWRSCRTESAKGNWKIRHCCWTTCNGFLLIGERPLSTPQKIQGPQFSDDMRKTELNQS